MMTCMSLRSSSRNSFAPGRGSMDAMMEEETGVIVRPLEQFLTLYEYYEEYRYISHYFICEVTGSGKTRLTEAEKQRGLEPRWIPLEEAVELFSRHWEYAETNEEKRGSYLREYTALLEYLKIPE